MYLLKKLKQITVKGSNMCPKC